VFYLKTGGKFGERWKNICDSFSVKTVILTVEWGKSPQAKEVKDLLDKNPDITAVYTTLCETSTATVYDIKSIAEVTKSKGVLLVVDAVSGLGQDVLKTDEWGVDVVVSGSQKGFMLSPGLAFISLSKKAQELVEKSDLPKFYFNLRKALKSYQENDTPYTPAVSLIVGLLEALKLIKAEGIDKRWERFEKMSKATRKALESLGLEVFSKNPSFSVTAACVKGVDTGNIVKKMRKEYGISIAGGQDQLKGKAIRIAHMGYINAQDVIMCLSVLEKVLMDLGLSFEHGISLKTFQEVYYG
jgi:aspartate aminotransferase-like enzyme